MAQWWEQSPPTNVARVRFPDMWVEFVVGSLLCSERFFFGYSGFPFSLKTNISKFRFDPGMHGHFWTSSCELLGAPWVNELHFHFILFSPYYRELKRSTIIIEREPHICIEYRNPCNSFSMVNMASGMDHGRVRPTTTTTTTSRNMAAFQLGSLSTDVFEPRTSTGNRAFSFLMCISPF